MGENERLSKDDLKFRIQLNLSNRDFLITCDSILLTAVLSFTAIVLSFYSILVSIVGFNEFTILVGIGVIFALIPYWFWTYKEYKRNANNSARFNKQYQKYLKRLYPKMKNDII